MGEEGKVVITGTNGVWRAAALRGHRLVWGSTLRLVAADATDESTDDA